MYLKTNDIILLPGSYLFSLKAKMDNMSSALNYGKFSLLDIRKCNVYISVKCHGISQVTDL